METPEDMRELAEGYKERKNRYCLQRFIELILWAARDRGGLGVRIHRNDVYQVGQYSDSNIDYAIGELEREGYTVTRRKRMFNGETIVVSWEAWDES